MYRGHAGSCVGRCCAADPVGTCPTRPVVSPQKAIASAGAGYRRVGEPCTSASIPIPIPIPMPMPMATTASYRTHCTSDSKNSTAIRCSSRPVLSCPAMQTLSRRCLAVGRAGRAVRIEDWPCRSPLRWRFPLCLPDRVVCGMASTRPTTRLFAHMRRAMPHPTRTHTHPLCLGRHKFQPVLARFVS
ncbi:hypothetical protein COCSADRAFT_265295 [Bipolaris sorokiniana ND90Pr]|uniref:Uncharacterized protein n=1 Tax=Cochliobolus sativus (strain ND90Pr / ATCC 201652) TaxID=665912 RepID=M2SNH2_COCSN|nr:uncharacterized protein COCSADRAFT_265295 [Bipolaris sorokiniana ND90Pr]EMD58686.1 hypothetical protein COCSADRAFT_265295 [Bipolaris sorokiniana ND90Pr]